uniref:Uncharacterized protein n=1 Tax=Vespula pensylvanica TaxID=30213 RepID=A0A834P6Y9_VESPE|nr:hypothetical protein H0235_004336 [Vespula pensylvanica]
MGGTDTEGHHRGWKESRLSKQRLVEFIADQREYLLFLFRDSERREEERRTKKVEEDRIEREKKKEEEDEEEENDPPTMSIPSTYLDINLFDGTKKGRNVKDFTDNDDDDDDDDDEDDDDVTGLSRRRGRESSQTDYDT